jgi:carbonic anhydrase
MNVSAEREYIYNPIKPDDIHKPDESVRDWQTALQYLIKGNQRFLSNQMLTRDTNEYYRNILKDGQKPFAVILACSDSRVPPEIIFDQGLGNIFVVRNAGNIADSLAMGSIEFAVAHLHAPLVVVVGHSECGAVKSAYADGGGCEEGKYSANLQSILNRIHNAIDGAATGVNEAINANVIDTVKQIQENETVRVTAAKVVGASYDIATGEVTWLP